MNTDRELKEKLTPFEKAVRSWLNLSNELIERSLEEIAGVDEADFHPVNTVQDNKSEQTVYDSSTNEVL